MILILSSDDDVHADVVERELRAVGAPVVRFDPARYPAETDLSVRIDADGRASGHLRGAGLELALAEIDVVWLRRPGRPTVAPPLAGTPAGAVIEAEAVGVLGDLWELLDAPFVPATPATLALASYKIRQLRLAARLGFTIPDTVATNDPDALLDMYTATGGRMITKRAVPSQRLFDVDGVPSARYTLAVRPRDLVDVESVRLGPILAQSMVDKDVEVRATVVGDEVFAAALHSQETHHTQVDFRRYDDARTRITPVELPPADARRCVELTAALGLRYAALDLVITPQGHVVFLEINPNGQYLWTERGAGLPISAAMARLLAESRRS